MSSPRLFTVTALAAAVACSSSSGTPSTPASSVTLKCGAGGLKGTVRMLDAKTLAAIAASTITMPGCNTVTTDDTGVIDADFELGKPLTPRFTAAGYVPGYGEVTPLSGGFDRTVYLVAETDKAALLTGWTPGSGYALVSVSVNGAASAACSSAAGLVVSVKGHPEITVGYMDGPTTRSAALTATTDLGLAAVGPIPPGTYEFDATKAGCAAGPDHGVYFLWPQTLAVQADTATFVQLKLP